MTTQSESGVRRVVEAYDAQSEELTAEYPLGDVPMAELRAVWDRPANDPMVDVYPIGPSEARALAPWTDVPFDFAHHDYFLASYRDDSHEILDHETKEERR